MNYDRRVADLPVKLGPMAVIPPAVRYRVTDALRHLPEVGEAVEGLALERLARLLDEGEPWLGADPQLAAVGMWMLEARHAVELRRRGCAWLAMFPSVATAKRLAEVALDKATPGPVREEAIRTLGDRQLRAMHPSTVWSADAMQVADDALVKLADAATTAGALASARLPLALRHVRSDGVAAVIARAPGLWGEAIECFASSPLARVLFVSLDEIPAQHRLRTLRLVGATLGEEAVPMLLARASTAAIDERLEMLLLAVGLGGEVHLGRLEDALRGMRFADLIRQRAKWHLANRGVVPTVRGLKVARVTATLPPAERAAKCSRAADDLGALTKFARHPEAYLYAMWAWMVRGSGDPGKTRDLVAAHPESQRLVRELYLEDLARRGRVKQLTLAAQALSGSDLGALWLAIHGRPLAALELAATARLQTPELVCARALACYRAGRPDLTERILVEDLPPSEVVDDDALAAFPGPHEQWMIEHASAARPALAALARGRAGVVAIAKPAPYDAEAEPGAFAAVGSVVRRLGRGLPGSTVYLAGEFERLDRKVIAAAVERAGARLVNGPFPGTDYYVHGDWCLVQTIAQLERQGARRLRTGELEGI
jgi:hypothetical protein